MKRPVKPAKKHRGKRDLFAELMEGMDALAEARQAKLTHRTHSRDSNEHLRHVTTKMIQAIFEHGMIRPLEPLGVPNGTRLKLIVITHEQPKANRNAAEILAEIAALPLEGSSEVKSDRQLDAIR